MKEIERLHRSVTSHPGCIWGIGGAFAGVLGFAVLVTLVAVFGPGGEAPPPAPVITVIARPTSTPEPPTAAPETETPTPPPASTASLVPGGPFAAGDLVEVIGTGGEGLRLHSSADVSAPVNLIAEDNEVYKVLDGPLTANGRQWYNLVNPYDSAKSGWAVSDFLQPVNTP